MAKTKIALFGGAFDPPHLGHQQVAFNLITQKIVDQVWFVPVYRHPWAKRLHKEFLTPYEMRVEMLESMVQDLIEKLADLQKTPQELRNESLGVLCELKPLWEPVKVAHFTDVSFTYNTLMHFSKENPDYEFSWVMGSEYLTRFEDFLATHPKLMDFTFYIYPREGFGFEPMYPNMVALSDMPEIEISSTKVREAVLQQATIESWVIEPVAEYIATHQLYQKAKQ